MKETIDLLGKILTNILTALYEPFGFSLLLSFLAMFLYLYAYEPQEAGKGWKSAIVTWCQKFKESVFFRKLFLLAFVTSLILFRTLLNRNLWMNPLSNVMGAWSLWETVNGEQKLTTKAGMSYRLLVIDRQVTRMTVDELKAIARLAKAGAPICGKRPTIQPNLKGDDAEWHRLVAEIWDSNRANVMENLSMEEALAKMGVAPDFSFVAADKDNATPDSIRWMHRRTADSEIYWVANAIDQPKRITASFNVTGKKPMLWNAENASIKPVGYTMADGRTSIDLDLDPYGALFIVFTEPTDEKHLAISHAEEQEVMTLDNDWHVYFGGVQDTPESIEMPTLRSLTESDDAQIRYFSGTAVYTRDFDVKGYNKRATYRLDLGGVGCMAEVYLNGQMLGTLWKAPYAIDITPALKKKGNKLEVRVTNLWANRVIGDKQPDKKKRYAWASYNNAFRASSKPLPAGLLGGVRLLCTPAGK